MQTGMGTGDFRLQSRPADADGRSACESSKTPGWNSTASPIDGLPRSRQAFLSAKRIPFSNVSQAANRRARSFLPLLVSL